MPIDPSIALSVQPAKVPTLGDFFARSAQMQAMQQEGQIRQMRLDEARRERDQQQQWGKALQGAYNEDGSLNEEALFSAVPPELMPTAVKFVTESRSTLQKYQDEQRKRKGEIVKDMAEKVAMLGYNPTVFGTALRAAVDAGALSREEGAQAMQSALQGGPDGIRGLVDRIRGVKPETAEVNPGATLVDKTTGRAIFTAPQKPATAPNVGSFEDYVVRRFGANPTPEQITQARKVYNQADDRPRISVTVPSGGGSDAEAIADAIISGNQPPTLTGLYRFAGPVRAILAKKGYDFTRASQDWKATERYLSTLNGPQQIRLAQATAFAKDSLDVIDDLAGKWNAGKFPILNRAHLTAAKNGAYGQDAASVATQLEAQISDLVSELGTVYKGGNSSTDESLKLAASNLKAEWSEKVLKDNIALVRKNLQIRLNSLAAVQPRGAREDNPYAPDAKPEGVEQWQRDPKTNKFVRKGST